MRFLLLLLLTLPVFGEITKASWYEDGDPVTYSGERFDPEAFTCASTYLPMHTLLKVSYTDTTSGRTKSIQVRVNDRMPYKWTYQGRKLDLTKKAFEALAPLGIGVVEVEVIETTSDPKRSWWWG